MGVVWAHPRQDVWTRGKILGENVAGKLKLFVGLQVTIKVINKYKEVRFRGEQIFMGEDSHYYPSCYLKPLLPVGQWRDEGVMLFVDCH